MAIGVYKNNAGKSELFKSTVCVEKHRREECAQRLSNDHGQCSDVQSKRWATLRREFGHHTRRELCDSTDTGRYWRIIAWLQVFSMRFFLAAILFISKYEFDSFLLSLVQILPAIHRRIHTVANFYKSWAYHKVNILICVWKTEYLQINKTIFQNLIRANDLNVHFYRYYDKTAKKFDIKTVLEDINVRFSSMFVLFFGWLSFNMFNYAKNEF